MHLPSTDLAAIFLGAVVIDVVFVIMIYADFVFVSREATRWYTRLGTAAMAMDILVIGLATTLGVHLTARATGGKPTLLQTAVGVVTVQVVHDVLFAMLFSSTPRGQIFIFDVFKDYAAEVGWHAVWSDSLMVLGTLAVAEATTRAPPTTKAVSLLASLYVALYVLYAKAPTPA